MHACPNRAACWSPATPATGTSWPWRASARVVPSSPQLGRTTGSARSGTPNRSSSAGDQVPSVMSNRSVREAFDGSVASSPVSLKISQASIVPNTARPLSARSRRPSTLSSSHSIFVAREVRVEHEPSRASHEVLSAVRAEIVATRRRATVLPHDRAVQRLAAARVPHAHRFALVGDPDGLELANDHSGVVERRLRPPPA